MIVALVEGVRRPGYDAWHQAVSALSLGPGGWVQQVNFILLGCAVLVTVPIWRRILAGGRAAASYPALTALLGSSFMAAAFVPQDPAPGYDPAGLALTGPTPLGLVHLGIAGIAAACSITSLVLIASRFAGDGHWRGWPAYSRLMAALMIASATTYGVWSTQATGFAGTFERIAVLIPAIWGFTFIRRLWAGTPFMVVSPAAVVAASRRSALTQNPSS
jgi:hypothetical protein